MINNKPYYSQAKEMIHRFRNESPTSPSSRKKVNRQMWWIESMDKDKLDNKEKNEVFHSIESKRVLNNKENVRDSMEDMNPRPYPKTLSSSIANEKYLNQDEVIIPKVTDSLVLLPKKKQSKDSKHEMKGNNSSIDVILESLFNQRDQLKQSLDIAKTSYNDNWMRQSLGSIDGFLDSSLKLDGKQSKPSNKNIHEIPLPNQYINEVSDENNMFELTNVNTQLEELLFKLRKDSEDLPKANELTFDIQNFDDITQQLGNVTDNIPDIVDKLQIEMDHFVVQFESDSNDKSITPIENQSNLNKEVIPLSEIDKIIEFDSLDNVLKKSLGNIQQNEMIPISYKKDGIDSFDNIFTISRHIDSVLDDTMKCLTSRFPEEKVNEISLVEAKAEIISIPIETAIDIIEQVNLKEEIILNQIDQVLGNDDDNPTKKSDLSLSSYLHMVKHNGSISDSPIDSSMKVILGKSDERLKSIYPIVHTKKSYYPSNVSFQHDHKSESQIEKANKPSNETKCSLPPSALKNMSRSVIEVPIEGLSILSTRQQRQDEFICDTKKIYVPSLSQVINLKTKDQLKSDFNEKENVSIELSFQDRLDYLRQIQQSRQYLVL